MVAVCNKGFHAMLGAGWEGGTRTAGDVEALDAGTDGGCQAGAPWERRTGAVAVAPPPWRLP